MYITTETGIVNITLPKNPSNNQEMHLRFDVPINNLSISSGATYEIIDIVQNVSPSSVIGEECIVYKYATDKMIQLNMTLQQWNQYYGFTTVPLIKKGFC